jgi:hypothetical protein
LFSTTKYLKGLIKKMTDQPNPERGAEQVSEGLPIPTLTQPSSDSSPSAVDTNAIVKQVTENLRRELRMAQSTKDKEISTIKKQLGISDLSELEEMGATIPENVKLEHRLRQLEQGRTPDNSPSQQAPSPGNGAALTAQDVSEAVQKFQLDANQPDVIEALRGTYRNRDHFDATLAQMALARATKQPPSPAASTALQSPPASSGGTDVTGLIAELSEWQKKPSQYRQQIKERVAELDKRGWK